MPQMFPMMWTIICLMSLIILSIIMTSQMKKAKNNKNMKMTSKNISWKW